MGQNNSRYQPPQPVDNSHDDDLRLPSTSRTTQSLAQSTVGDRPSYVANNLDLPASPSRLSRHSLLRRNFLGFTKSPSQSSSREGSLASSSSNRRSWFNPRRWSRAPSSLAEAADDHPYNLDGPSNTPINAKGKEKEGAGVRDSQSQLSTDRRPPDSNPLLSPQIAISPSTGDSVSEPAELSASGFAPVDEPLRLPSPVASLTQRDDDSRLQPTTTETQIIDKQSPAPAPEPPTIDGRVETAGNQSPTTEVETSLATNDGTPGSSEPPGGNASTTAAAAAPAAVTTRPFPPPGTLVVVQGVVHTTDVPRSSVGSSDDSALVDGSRTQPSRSPSQERNGASARSRLSTLLRPRSAGPTFGVGLSDDAAQMTQQADDANPNIDDSTGAVENSRYTNQESGDTSSSPPVGTDELTTMGNEPSRATLPGSQHNDGRQDATPSEGEQDGVSQRNSDDANGSGPISSSSIDVLGTLLSVAAAATAASLLTGSSEPILQPNAPASSTPSTTPSQSTRSNNTPSPDFSAAGRAERMRSAWTSIRERLGIRSAGSSNSPSSNNTGTGAATQSAAEAREMMLGEMARAFSVGLGLGSFSGPTSSNNNLLSRPTETSPPSETRAAPSEGSFERFLMDLQADLRIALTTGEGGSGVRAMAAGSGWSDARSASPSNALEAPSGEVDTASADNAGRRDDPVQQNESSDDQYVVPPLLETSNSEEESHAASSSEAATGVDSAIPQGGEGQRLTGPGRINWWRLYRFPAIGVPRSNSAAGAAAAAALSNNSANASSASLAPSSTPAIPSGQGAASTTVLPTMSSATRAAVQSTEDSPSSAANATTPSTVVPVIIVGLQSVHMDLRQAEQAGFNPNDHHLQHRDDDDIVDDGIDDIFGPSPDHDSSPDRDTDALSEARSTSPDVPDTEGNHRRGRRWRSRAADAFRSLRPRRGVEQRSGATTSDTGTPHLVHQMPPMGPGSRMFLIYVIGGYYPPNHSIVLGNPADLESFEALSELADLLGQVKPPTATKEEIEKSGLQVFKASKIREYEQEGKISSNCVERCLICLDDYDLEDDVRLMTCRHAFHKDCVDKWLETGKNNCPACRSRGVSTETRGTFVS